MPGGSGRPVTAVVVQDESSEMAVLKDLTLRYALARPDLVVWPEYAVLDYPLSDPDLLAEMQGLARTMDSVLVAGCKEEAPPYAPCDPLRRRAMRMEVGHLFYNTALVLGPRGELLGVHRKTHPIQFFADGVPGRVYLPIETPIGPIGVSICYDFDFAGTALREVRKGARILVVPTHDSREWGALQHLQHARMAQARAAEVGRWVVRAVSSGPSQLIDPHGRPVLEIAYGARDAAMGRATAETALTTYARYGFALPYVCTGITLIWIAVMLVTRGRGRERHKPMGES